MKNFPVNHSLTFDMINHFCFRPTGGRRSGGRRDRNRGRGQLSKDDNTENENKEEINDVGLLREEIENKIEDKVKRLESNDEEGEEDIEFYDVE